MKLKRLKSSTFASGHRAGCLSQGFDHADWLLDPDGTLADISARPDASILSYPVISSGSLGHQGSFDNLLGKDNDSAQREALSWEKLAHPNSPPTFLWHTAEDVPVENSYLMAMALQQNKTPHELHVFPKGEHGLGLCSIDFRRQSGAAQWRALAQRWLLELGF